MVGAEERSKGIMVDLGPTINIDRDPPLDRDPGTAPALTESEIDDVIAFLQTLTDGYSVPAPAAARAP